MILAETPENSWLAVFTAGFTFLTMLIAALTKLKGDKTAAKVDTTVAKAEKQEAVLQRQNVVLDVIEKRTNSIAGVAAVELADATRVIAEMTKSPSDLAAADRASKKVETHKMNHAVADAQAVAEAQAMNNPKV